MVGLLDGRVYYNLLNWYEMLSYLPGFHQHKKSWDLMIGISKNLEFPQSKLTGFQSLVATIRAIQKLLLVRRNSNSIQHGEEEIRHRGGVLVLYVPPRLYGSAAAARHDYRQVVVVMAVSVADSCSVDYHRVIQQGAVTVIDALHLFQDVG